MKKIFRVDEVPAEEQVYLKKDILGWRTVEPYRRENGSLNWWSVLFGGKRGLAFMLWMFLIIGLFFVGTYELTKGMRDIVENPCKYCSQEVQEYITPDELSNLNITVQQ